MRGVRLSSGVRFPTSVLVMGQWGQKFYFFLQTMGRSSFAHPMFMHHSQRGDCLKSRFWGPKPKDSD